VDNGHGKCECHAPGATFESDKSCSCGPGAALSEDGKSCQCTAPTNSIWTKGKNGKYSCSCPSGQSPKNGACTSQPPSCGSDATPNEYGTCTCKAPGATFGSGKTCTCDGDASLSRDGKSCVCSAAGASWTKDKAGKYGCVCSNGQKPKNGVCPSPTPDCGRSATPDSKGNCVCKAPGAAFKNDKTCSCGSDASLSSDGKSCVCTVTGTKWTKNSYGQYSCVCPDGQKLKNGHCVTPGPDCGRDATNQDGQCVCKAPGATFKNDKSCGCGRDASLSSDGKKCVCSAKGANWTKNSYGQYSCACPSGQTVKNGVCTKPEPTCGRGATKQNGLCACKAPGATLSKYDQSCSCGPKASLSQDGSKCQCSTKGASWTKASNGGYSCQCPSGQTERNGVCQPNAPSCGRYASATYGSGCECKAEGATFRTSDKSCSCGPNASLSSSGDACVCDATGAKWTYGSSGKYSCQCPNGHSPVNGSCEPDCGAQAKYKSGGYGPGTCVCNNSNLVYNSSRKTCDCGSDATLDSRGSGCICKKSGMLWGAVSHTCACPKGMQYKGNKCQKATYGD
jgi:hypothetical protein